MKSLLIPRLLFVLFFITIISISKKSYSQTKPWVAPPSAQANKNPITPSATVLKEGKNIYMANCAPCHGDKGKGDGPAAAALNPKPADHTSPVLSRETDGALFWKISEGRTPMPTYKTMLSETQRWELVDYIRSLSKVKK